ncbi:MAG: hypothetical protein GXO35_08670, partial [Gammaproteobacteria bacterium]|nr:hypothetical protein [Gammaproteobacteria bacterium]
MGFDRNRFALEIMDKALWWRWSVDNTHEKLVLSDAFLAFFVRSIDCIEDLTGAYSSPILKIKIEEILASPYSDVRFSASYETVSGKKSFQHRLNSYEENGVRYVWANCIDITERTNLEREFVDTQRDSSLGQLYEKQ